MEIQSIRSAIRWSISANWCACELYFLGMVFTSTALAAGNVFFFDLATAGKTLNQMTKNKNKNGCRSKNTLPNLCSRCALHSQNWHNILACATTTSIEILLLQLGQICSISMRQCVSLTVQLVRRRRNSTSKQDDRRRKQSAAYICVFPSIYLILNIKTQIG